MEAGGEVISEGRVSEQTAHHPPGAMGLNTKRTSVSGLSACGPPLTLNRILHGPHFQDHGLRLLTQLQFRVGVIQIQ
jgi:hypothetical protein